MIKYFFPTFLAKAPCPPLDLHIEALIAEPTSKLKAGQVKNYPFFLKLPKNLHQKKKNTENISVLDLLSMERSSTTLSLVALQILRRTTVIRFLCCDDHIIALSDRFIAQQNLSHPSTFFSATGFVFSSSKASIAILFSTKGT